MGVSGPQILRIWGLGPPILTPNPSDLGSKWLPTFGREVPTSGWDPKPFGFWPKSFGFWVRTLSGHQKSTIFDAKSQILTLNPLGFGSKSGILPRGALVSPNLRLKLRSRAPPGTPERSKIYRFGTSTDPKFLIWSPWLGTFSYESMILYPMRNA